jgi:hypothetical protein
MQILGLLGYGGEEREGQCEKAGQQRHGYLFSWREGPEGKNPRHEIEEGARQAGKAQSAAIDPEAAHAPP